MQRNGACARCEAPGLQKARFCTSQLSSVICYGCGKIKSLESFEDSQIPRTNDDGRYCIPCLIDLGYLCQQPSFILGGVKMFACGACKKIFEVERRVRINGIQREIIRNLQKTSTTDSNLDSVDTIDNLCLVCAEARGWKYERSRMEGAPNWFDDGEGYGRVVDVCIRYDGGAKPRVIVVDPFEETNT